MADLIAFAILLFSVFGMSVILFRKIPDLVEIEETSLNISLRGSFSRIAKKVIIFTPFRNFSSEIFLQKVVSRARILSLKMDSKTSNWLQRLREKSQEKRNRSNDNYWREIKTSLSDKDKLDSLSSSSQKKSIKK